MAGLAALLWPAGALAEDSGWSLGVYGGPYYDTEPAGFLNGRAGYKDQYLLALTASKTLWRSESLPLALEIDGRGSQWLSFLMLELDFAPPQEKSWEVFVRLHHRCAIYDRLNDYGANGEDFVALGWRSRF
jgi:hypothetical protein